MTIQSTLLNATTLEAPQSGRLQEVVTYRKDQQNKPNAGLIN